MSKERLGRFRPGLRALDRFAGHCNVRARAIPLCPQSMSRRGLAWRPPRTTFRVYKETLPLVGNIGDSRASVELVGNISQAVILGESENPLFQFIGIV